MSFYPKNPIGPIPIGIIVFFGFFMVDPAMIFSKGDNFSAPPGMESAPDFGPPEPLLSREDLLLP